MLAGGLIGFVCGLIFHAVGLSMETIRLIVMPLAFVSGLAISLVPMKMILGKDFGEFRLVLLQKQ